MMKPILRTKLAQRTEDDHFRVGSPDAQAQILNPGPGSDNLPFSAVGGPTTIATTNTNGGNIVSVSAERLDGSTVVLWIDRNPGGGNEDVRATVIAANGTVLVPSFNVSLSPAGRQDVPAVEVRASDGAFFAAWRSSDSNNSIHTQLFDATGVRIGSEVVVTTNLGVGDNLIEIAPLSDGGFMLLWQVYLTEEIRAQRFDSTGAELGAELSLIPNNMTMTGNDHELIGVHQLASGELAVTVREILFATSVTQGFLRTFDLAGNPTDTAETFPAPSTVGGYASTTAFAADGSSITLFRGQDGVVSFQPFDATGEKIGGVVNLNPPLDPPLDVTQQIGNNLVALPGGEYMFVWTGPAFDGTGNSIFGRTFSIDGVRTSPTFELATSDLPSNSRPLVVTDITAEDDGSIVLTWNLSVQGIGNSLMTQRFEPQAYPPSGTFTGTPNYDNLVGGTGNDIINALGGNDRLYGGAGNDQLNGGTGADVTDGGAGDDFHYVDNLGDVVIELAGEGYDNLQSSIDWVLAEGVYVEVLSTTLNAGTGRIDLTGNSLANVIVGNDGKNVIDGKGGDDILVGLGGDDFFLVDAVDRVYENAGGGYDNVLARQSYTLLAGQEIEVLSTTNNDGTDAINLTGNEFGQVLVGNSAANVLNGGGGADILQGLDGNDVYIVDADDRVYEAADGGSDYVATKTSYALLAGQHVEILSTTDNAGTTAINLTGNELDQVLVGNAGNNIINGGGGGGAGGGSGDIMDGLGGNDTYIVDTGDRVYEAVGRGSDSVAAKVSFALLAGQEIELLSTSNNGGTASINLTGNEFGQVLVGNAGNNVLDGGLGNDLLQGLSGADEFTFTTALGAGNVDTILDFVAGTDRIAIDNAVFNTLPNGALNPNAFFAGTAAHDADDRIIYDSATGQLFYDADGNGAGAQVLFATLTGAPVITASDFLVI
jgi:Ca2+-binding RTX toxin-like protein